MRKQSKAARAAVDTLWTTLLAKPDTEYKAAMLEAKAEYEEWLERSRSPRAMYRVGKKPAPAKARPRKRRAA